MPEQPDFIPAEEPDFIPAGGSVESPIAPPGIKRPDVGMHRVTLLDAGNADESMSQGFHRAMNEARSQGKVLPQDIARSAVSDIATLSRAAPQAMVKGITGSTILGEPPSNQQLLSSGKNIGLSMLMGGIEGEGIPPTARLNQVVNRVPTSDPGFGIASKLAREIPGIGGVLRKIDLIKSINDRIQGPSPAPAPKPGELPPEAPEIVRQAWAMQRGGQPPNPAQTGEALGKLNVPRGTSSVNTQPESYQAVPLKVPAPKAPVDPYAGARTPVMEPSQSTTIAHHGYVPESQTMVLQFKNGNVYEYRGVPQEVWDAYKNSESQGSFFANNIKGRYTTNLRGSVGKSAGQKVREALGRKPSNP